MAAAAAAKVIQKATRVPQLVDPARFTLCSRLGRAFHWSCEEDLCTVQADLAPVASTDARDQCSFRKKPHSSETQLLLTRAKKVARIESHLAQIERALENWHLT